MTIRSFDLRDDTVQLLDEQLRSGRAANPDAIIRAGIAALERAAAEHTKLEALRAAIDEGDAAPDAEDSSLAGILAELKLPQPTP
jgi:putative addiction module CopG family antidote